MGGRFLNIELEVRGTGDLAPLLSGFGERVYLDFCGETQPGQYLLSVALSESLLDSSPDSIAQRLCEAIETLDADSRRIWEDASDRCFDVGFDAESDRSLGLHIFSPETLRRIGSVRARVAISIYTLEQA